jgi:hypothetical protein
MQTPCNSHRPGSILRLREGPRRDTPANDFVPLAELPFCADAKGKKVVVIGGGDTGVDCIGTALRQARRRL